MKNGFLVLVLAALVAGGAFAQAEKGKKNTITMDLIPLVKGFLASDSDANMFFFDMSFAYERQIVPHLTIGAELELYPGKVGEDADGDAVGYLYFSMAAAARYYPMSENTEKFFIGTNLGFNVQAVDGKTKPEYGGFAGPLIGLRTGYKLLLGKKKMFVVEPSIAYVYSKYFYGPTPLGWQGGLRLGVSF